MEAELSNEEILADYAKEAGGASGESTSGVKDIKHPSPGEASQAKPAETTPAPTTPQKYKYKTEGGKEIEEDIETILKRAGLGYHAAQRLEGVNKREQEYNQTQERIKQLAKWEEYDKYAKENPAWRDHVEKSWESRDQALAAKADQLSPNDPQQDVIKSLREQILGEIKKEFAPVTGYVEQMKQAQEQQRIQHHDRTFDTEVKTVRQAFGNVDFDQADEHGRSLEYRVLTHMTENNIPSFRAAYLDLDHSRLLDRTKQEALEQYAKGKKEDAKKGIIGKSSTPQTGEPKGLSNGKVRSTNYDQIGDLIKQELGLM